MGRRFSDRLQDAVFVLYDIHGRGLSLPLKQLLVEQIILSGMLPVMGSRGQGYRNCRRMAINTLPVSASK